MGTQWTRSDVAGTLRVLDRWWDLLAGGVEDLTDASPAPGEPSFSAIREVSIRRLIDAQGTDPDGLVAVVLPYVFSRRPLGGLSVAADEATIYVEGHGLPRDETLAAHGLRRVSSWDPLFAQRLDLLQRLRG